jgi:hypothetical protein
MKISDCLRQNPCRKLARDVPNLRLTAPKEAAMKGIVDHDYG